MVIFSVLSGFFIYLYQLAMGILLTPQDFATLFSLTSLFSIVAISGQAVSGTVSRYTSKITAEGKTNSIGYLWHLFLKRASVTGVLVFSLFVLLSPLISAFLGIGNPFYIIILFSVTLILFVFVTNQGMLNGLQRFPQLGASLVIEGLIVLVIGYTLVRLGLGIYGGLVAFPVAYISAAVFSFYFLRDFRKAGRESVVMSGIGSYAGYTLLAVIMVTVLTNIDVVLAKHYLTITEAGSYAAMSVIGRIALYSPLGISTVMFPKTALLFEQGGSHLRLFLKALLITSFISLSIVLFCSLFPRLIVTYIFGNKYPLMIPNLGTYSLVMALFGLLYVNMRYFLSINRTSIAYVLLVTALFQITLIVLFHQSIAQIVKAMLTSSAVSFLLLVPFYLHLKSPRRNGEMKRRGRDYLV